MIELAPSILSADFAHLAEQVQRATEGGGTLVHVDIMDGHFVPNLTIGPPVVKSLRKATDLPLDCHLMIENPDEFIPMFIEAGANWISVHQEACRHLDRTLHHIREHGALAGVVLNPATPVEMLSEVFDIVDYVLIMSVNPGFRWAEVLAQLPAQNSEARRSSGSARTEFPHRSGWWDSPGYCGGRGPGRGRNSGRRQRRVRQR